jgi:anti-sigma B factor antagonist
VRIDERRDGDVMVFTVHGPLTSGGAEGNLRRIIRAVVDSGAPRVVINLEDVVDIDSSGVAELASGHIAATNRGCMLTLCCLSRKLRHIFAITRLNDVFRIYDSEAEALAASADKP